ncbi:MAG TPA: polyamine aminopropyltransferase [Kofleriaceae bacterium]
MESLSSSPPPSPAPAAAETIPATALYLNVFVVAICGLVYELLAGTLGSYLLGDSVTQFSLVIGLYLSAMGLGAYVSRKLDGQLARRFIEIELAVAIVGGLSAPVLFLCFGTVVHFQVVLLAFVAAIGVLVGLELPILMRLLEGQVAFKDLISRVLTFDYIGALAASLMFPLVLVPKLGLVRSSLAMGCANAVVALWGTWLLAPQLGKRAFGLRVRGAIVLIAMIGGVVIADYFTTWAEDEQYADPVVYTKQTTYQRIVVTHGKAGFQLFLNGNLQFSSADEYRYHEALVHPVMAAADAPPKNVLILGGGDGLALREVLTYKTVEHATLVDLDPAMTQLSVHFPALAELNHHSFADPRVTVINDDALVWLDAHPGTYDAIVVDFPDPNTFALGKLFTKLFYRRVRAHLAPTGAVVVQATSPLFARRSYWCIADTMAAAGLSVQPYQVTVPSFGVWGYVLARTHAFDPPTHVPPKLRFLNDQALAAMFEFPADETHVPVEINQLDNQALVRYYEREWRRWE